MGEVTEEEGDAIDVRAAVAEQRRRRRRRHRQMARLVVEEELEAEFNRRLAREVMDTCNSNELELLFPEGRGRNHIQIISWARARAAAAPHPPLGQNGVVSLIVMTEVVNIMFLRFLLWGSRCSND